MCLLILRRHVVYQGRTATQSGALEWANPQLDTGWRRYLNPERGYIVRAATSQILLSGSIGEPAFPFRPGSAQAAERNEADGRSGATRSHAQHVRSRASMARMASTGPSQQ
jgi:hypothetical protein